MLGKLFKKTEKKAKPIREVTGNDPRLAEAMRLQAQENMTPEEHAESEKKKWLAEHMDRVQAHGERFFETDEDLPLSSHLLLFFIVAFFVIFFLWASFAELDEVTRGNGTVIPSSEVQKVSSLEGGIIEELMVKKGDEVQKGDTLARLSDIAASSDLGSNEARYLGLLAAVTRLQAEVEGRIPEFPNEVMEGAPQSVTEEMNAYRANMDQINSQTVIMEQQKSQRSQELNELQVRASDVRGQLRLIKEEKDIVAPLVAKGSAPKMELLQLDRQIKEKQTELNGVLSAIPRARSAIGEANARIRDVKSAAKAQAQTELSAKLIEMNAIKKGLAGLQDRKTRAEIKSPVNGYIKDVKVYTIGGVVQPGQEFIEIVPKDDQLLVQANINPKDIAFLYPDQPAIVKITAYDFAIYGGLKGKVVAISPDAVTNEEGESFYQVQVLTEENALKRKGEVLPIIPGMVASVDILTGEKTVMEYLLKPFIKTLQNSMNER
ncbi:MAG: HlyD family type I secretion periplasmic adaptor subunit [Alphaproteobacteria bacterium]|nr:HlyD family type I secretion periplasmic adaptor subunit [Alphaproteobacteria bacterium]